MDIRDGRTVHFEFTLRLLDGRVVESSVGEDPLDPVEGLPPSEPADGGVQPEGRHTLPESGLELPPPDDPQLGARLRERFSGVQRAFHRSHAVELADPRTREALEALGYVEGRSD